MLKSFKKILFATLLGMPLMFASETVYAQMMMMGAAGGAQQMMGASVAINSANAVRNRNARQQAITGSQIVPQKDSGRFVLLFKPDNTDYNDFGSALLILNEIEKISGENLYIVSGSSESQVRKVVKNLIGWKNSYRYIIRKYDNDSQKDIVTVVVGKDGCSPGYLKDKESKSCKKMKADTSVVQDFLMNNIPSKFTASNQRN